MNPYITIIAALFVANEIGIGRMNPWVGLFVLGALGLQVVRTIYKSER